MSFQSSKKSFICVENQRDHIDFCSTKAGYVWVWKCIFSVAWCFWILRSSCSGAFGKTQLLNKPSRNIFPVVSALLYCIFSFLSTDEWVHLSICRVKAMFLKWHLDRLTFLPARSFLSALIPLLYQMTPSAPEWSRVTHENALFIGLKDAVVSPWKK